MILGLSLTPFGHDPSAWRENPTPAALSFSALLDQVLLVQEAGFDFVLLADRMGERPLDQPSPLAVPFEPTTLASALSTRAKEICFISTAATHQHEPYNLSRRIASVDWISAGRIGWNIVAGSDIGRDREYVELVGRLWDSWDDDAFLYDKRAGRFFDPAKMHMLDHNGENFAVRGPLNVNRPPQGRPVISSRGGSCIDDLADVLFISEDAQLASVVQLMDKAGRMRADIRLIDEITDLRGTPATIAAALQLRIDQGVDGFLIVPPTIAALRTFIADVLPEFGARGLVGARSGPPTLRDRLGLARPAFPPHAEILQ